MFMEFAHYKYFNILISNELNEKNRMITYR